MSGARRNEGMPYGGMPHDALLLKLEETDADYDELSYDDYARGEIIDRTPDGVFLESDQVRRDPGISRSMINIRYNGTRGSNPGLPRHPDMFYGFMDRDPRGAETDPRLNQVRGQMATRINELTVRMGNNDDNHIAERPWTGQAISEAMQEVHRRQKSTMRIFTAQKEGRPWGNNVASDEYAGGILRAAAMGAGGESLGYSAGAGAAPERFIGGDHGPADEAWTADARGVDAGAMAADAAPWRHTVGEADLGVQQYGQKRGAGRSDTAPGAQGGARLLAQGADQTWAGNTRALGTNRRDLGATMAAAARHRRAVKSGAHDQDPGAAYEAAAAGAGLAPARDVARAYHHAVEDQSRRPEAEVQDGDRLGAAAGLAPATHPPRAARASQAQAAANAHLTTVGAIVAGLREGSAAGRRRIAGAVAADGARHLAASEAVAGARRGAVPGADQGSVARLSEVALTHAAAAEGLVVHAYGGAAPPARPERRAAHAQNAYDGVTWRASHEAAALGAGKLPNEWRSQTQAQTALGDAPERTFGPDAEVAGYQGAHPMGPKSLRAGGWSDSANLSDAVGGFSDGVDASA